MTVSPTVAPCLPALFRAGLERHARRVREDWDGRHPLHGMKPPPGAVMVNSNDYLALARHPRIVKAMAETLTADGNDTLMSGVFLSGDHPQLRLEADLARHMGAPAGILCQSGWAANTGLLQALAEPGTPVYIDMLAHMSLWEGARISGAALHRFRHNDTAHLRRRIADHGPGIILVDSIYSTDGSLCPLARVADLADEYACVLVVDESHSLGTHGDLGEGMTGAAGLNGRVHFQTASLSKAFAGRAGFIAVCEEAFTGYFKMRSHPAVFSSTLLPHDIAGLTETLAVVRADTWRRARLAEIATRVRHELTDAGVDLHSSGSHILSLVGGDERHTMTLRDGLEQAGVFGSVFCPPATPRTRSLVRFSLHADLSDTQVDHLISSSLACYRP
ncbi:MULTISPECIES: alpha-hydroxyketone-type quorum-sensing autoinducer synthase [unclassified Streptomyces]|uniref:alpha-hydroxyketone-type quorum-sensing autoinducer synthase n=1 Tax=unclassified Streptomyces TaxID=2593676 RepID=UPI00224E74CE|nr:MULTISPECIES: alpha-hydroxyketone-type quorum-sensing autoinducer synthase [unclassified Streptomyces]MCX4529915.1 quorum-sensing autoinducer CAI-1 synthase [Streptomyces sp. NBC_01551]MCX4546854.1 quorum-sensing autoinducer CAI-1 synthase [Streptomyces sp. NBC_01565]